MWNFSQFDVLRSNHPLIMAHRGDSGTVPENTFLAFEAAIKLGVDVVETDVRITKDGKLVFFHDSKLGRTTNGKGSISHKTLDELKKLDAGYNFSLLSNPNMKGRKSKKSISYPYRNKGLKILSVEEVLNAFPNQAFNMDIKPSLRVNKDISIKLAELLKKLNAEKRVIVGSFHQAQIDKFRKYSECPTSAGPKEVIEFWCKFRKWTKMNKKEQKMKKIWIHNKEPIHNKEIINNFEIINREYFAGGENFEFQKELFGKQLDYVALQIPLGFGFITLVNSDFITFAHRLGIAVHVWTINSETMMKTLLEWNVDGIFTDNPNILKNILKPRRKEKEENKKSFSSNN